MIPCSVLSLVLFFLCTKVNSFYIPEGIPHEFGDGDNVSLNVNSMTSYHTQIPKDYYRLPFCIPSDGPRMDPHSFGELLTGNKIQSSPYQLNMKTDVYCKLLCQRRLSKIESAKLRMHIIYNYHNNWIVDNIPSAVVRSDLPENEKRVRYSGGFPIGFINGLSKMAYVHNHVNIILDYHQPNPAEQTYRIVRFKVEPMSVKHAFQNQYEWDGEAELGSTQTLSTCKPGQHMDRNQIHSNQIVATDERILYTYDVIWQESEDTWSARWDIYLNEDHWVPNQVHWYQILNSLLLIIFLSTMVVTALVGHLRKDTETFMSVPLLVNSNAKAKNFDEEGTKDMTCSEGQQKYPMLLSVCVGSGVQLLVCTFLGIALSALGILNASRRGSLIEGFLLLYMMCGFFNGYVSSTLYKACGGEKKHICTLAAAFGISGAVFSFFLVFNVIFWFIVSTPAPFSVVVMLSVMCCISAVMVFVGAHIGFKHDETINLPTISRVDAKGKHPTPMSNMSRSTVVTLMLLATLSGTIMVIANIWADCMFGILMIIYTIAISAWATFKRLPRWAGVISAGVLPFAVLYVENFFMMTSLWMNQYYYVYCFALLVYIELIVVVAEVTILFVYNEVCSGTSRVVWWPAFLAGASAGLYAFLYSFLFFRYLEAMNSVVTFALYFAAVSVLCGGVSLVTGSIGLLSSLWFVRTIVGEQAEIESN